MAIRIRAQHVRAGLFILSYVLLAVICISIYHAPDARLPDKVCPYRVITLDGEPYEAADDTDELLGYFDRQPDGAVWLRGVDTSVEDASGCLKRRGFSADKPEYLSLR